MPWLSIVAIATVGLGAAMVGVVTGGNSLVTVPVMLALKMSPRQAVATNMFAVTFLALSGALTFALHRPTTSDGSAPPAPTKMRWDLIGPLLPITLLTSWIGARLASSMNEATMKIVVAVSLVAMLAVMVFHRGFGQAPARPVGRGRLAVGLALAAVLGVYGGLFSGGYTTLMTFLSVGLLGASLLEALGLTKVINFASSAIATLEFIRGDLVDWKVGVPMGAMMLVGAWLGARFAIKRGATWVRRLMLVSIAALAAKLVVVDLILR